MSDNLPRAAVTLRPCPFCGGPAETDSRQPYMSLDGSYIGSQAAVYCTGACGATMTLCAEDVPGMLPEEALGVLIENWNRRVNPDER